MHNLVELMLGTYGVKINFKSSNYILQDEAAAA